METPSARHRRRHPGSLPAGRCAGCGADVAIDPGRHLVRCAHCGAANLVAGHGTIPVAHLRPTVGEREVDAVLRRLSLERDLDAIPRVIAREEVRVPYWASLRDGSRSRSVRAAVEVEDPVLAEIPAPQGEWQPLDAAAAEADPAWPWPEVPPQEGEALRYVPFYRMRLRAGTAEVDAYVDRGSGRVFLSAPLNPERLRFGAALAILMATYAIVCVAAVALAPTLLHALAICAAVTAAVVWPMSRAARRPGLRGTDAPEGPS